MFKLTFERVYFQHKNVQEPSVELRANAEAQIAMLHPERTHTLSTKDGRGFFFTPLASSEGWYVTYTPIRERIICADCGADVTNAPIAPSHECKEQRAANRKAARKQKAVR